MTDSSGDSSRLCLAGAGATSPVASIQTKIMKRSIMEAEMQLTRRSLLLSGAALGASGVLQRRTAFAAAQELKLGVVGVLSGPAAQWGLALRGAVELVAAEANRDG